MRFTLWMVGAPIVLFVLAMVVHVFVSREAALVFSLPSVLWLAADLFVLPLYWAARIVKNAWSGS